MITLQEGTWLNAFASKIIQHVFIEFLMAQVRETESRTVGSLDMGGASTQVSFIPANEAAIPSNFAAEVTLFGDTFTTYSRSYLCFGMDEATRRILATIVKVTVSLCAMK